MKRVLIPSLVLAGFLAGCATGSQKEREALLAAPVNCATASSDIAALEAAKPSRREKVRSAVQSATPVGAVKGVVSGTYDDGVSVLTGATEEELSARINEIRSECGIAETVE